MKKFNKVFLSLSLALSISVSSCQEPAEISLEEVTRIVSTLADDDMEGRGIFTPGIDKASQFIQGEFEKAGLEYLDGLSSYDQQFDMYTLAPESMNVSLNGKAQSESNVIAMVNSANIKWDKNTVLEVSVIGADEDFRAAFNGVRNAKGMQMVLVNTAHKDMFARYKGFFSRGSNLMKMDEENAAVMVLTNLKSFNTLDVDISNSITEKSLSNVTGKISGKRANEIVLFSAHYDHLGIRGTEGDIIFNGANDDASGTTAVITLAKYFKDMGGTPERTIVFTAFTAEESGGYGSKYFSENMDPDQIIAMFNIEMIGKGATEGPNTAWITGFERSSFGTLLQQAVEGTEYEFYPDPYPDQNLFYRSDNATLARLGVPAHSISTSPIDTDPDYHKASDEVSTMDMAHMTNTIKAIAAAAKRMISGEDTPTRVDPATVN
jgi:hypothetical protein